MIMSCNSQELVTQATIEGIQEWLDYHAFIPLGQFLNFRSNFLNYFPLKPALFKEDIYSAVCRYKQYWFIAYFIDCNASLGFACQLELLNQMRTDEYIHCAYVWSSDTVQRK